MVINKLKMWLIMLVVTMSFRVIIFMSILSMKRIMIMRMMMESTDLIFHNLEAMIMLKLLKLTMVSHIRKMLSKFGIGRLAKH